MLREWLLLQLHYLYPYTPSSPSWVPATTSETFPKTITLSDPSKSKIYIMLCSHKPLHKLCPYFAIEFKTKLQTTQWQNPLSAIPLPFQIALYVVPSMSTSENLIVAILNYYFSKPYCYFEPFRSSHILFPPVLYNCRFQYNFSTSKSSTLTKTIFYYAIQKSEYMSVSHGLSL